MRPPDAQWTDDVQIERSRQASTIAKIRSARAPSPDNEAIVAATKPDFLYALSLFADLDTESQE